MSYEGLRLAQPIVGTTTVINPAFLNGDFSSVTTQLKNPATGVAYVGNQIPVSSFDPIGKYILQRYPQPNAGYNTAAAAPGYTFNQKRIENLDEGSARVDHKFSEKDSVLVQYNYFNDPSFEPSLSLCSSALIPGSGCLQNQISTLIGINETHIFNAHWLNELRLASTDWSSRASGRTTATRQRQRFRAPSQMRRFRRTCWADRLLRLLPGMPPSTHITTCRSTAGITTTTLWTT